MEVKLHIPEGAEYNRGTQTTLNAEDFAILRAYRDQCIASGLDSQMPFMCAGTTAPAEPVAAEPVAAEPPSSEPTATAEKASKKIPYREKRIKNNLAERARQQKVKKAFDDLRLSMEPMLEKKHGKRKYTYLEIISMAVTNIERLIDIGIDVAESASKMRIDANIPLDTSKSNLHEISKGRYLVVPNGFVATKIEPPPLDKTVEQDILNMSKGDLQSLIEEVVNADSTVDQLDPGEENLLQQGLLRPDEENLLRHNERNCQIAPVDDMDVTPTIEPLPPNFPTTTFDSDFRAIQTDLATDLATNVATNIATNLATDLATNTATNTATNIDLGNAKVIPTTEEISNLGLNGRFDRCLNAGTLNTDELEPELEEALDEYEIILRVLEANGDLEPAPKRQRVGSNCSNDCSNDSGATVLTAATAATDESNITSKDSDMEFGLDDLVEVRALCRHSNNMTDILGCLAK